MILVAIPGVLHWFPMQIHSNSSTEEVYGFWRIFDIPELVRDFPENLRASQKVLTLFMWFIDIVSPFL